MPYKLRKAPKRELYWVVTSETGKKHSKDPIPIEKAKAQLRILKSVGNGLCQSLPAEDESWMESPMVKALSKQHMRKVADQEFSKKNPGVLAKNAKKAKERLQKTIGGGYWKDKAYIELMTLFLELNADFERRGLDRVSDEFFNSFLQRIEETLQEAPISGATSGILSFIAGDTAKRYIIDAAKRKLREAFATFERETPRPAPAPAPAPEPRFAPAPRPPRAAPRPAPRPAPAPEPARPRLPTGPRPTEFERILIRNSIPIPTPGISTAGQADELKKAKSAYRKAALLLHPDKGGNPLQFREMRDAYERIWVPRGGRMGGALKGTNIAMSLFPAIRSAKSPAQAIQFYRTIITAKEKDELNHYVSLVTNKHWRNFADVPSVGEMNHIIDLILKYGELRASAPSWTPEPSEAEKLESVRKSWGGFRGGAEEDLDAELAELMGALPMPGEERPPAPAPGRGRVQRVGRVAMFEPPPIRVPARGVQYRRGTKRTLERRESGRGKRGGMSPAMLNMLILATNERLVSRKDTLHLAELMLDALTEKDKRLIEKKRPNLLFHFERDIELLERQDGTEAEINALRDATVLKIETIIKFLSPPPKGPGVFVEPGVFGVPKRRVNFDPPNEKVAFPPEKRGRGKCKKCNLMLR